ncbi:MAG TPA: hemerythrin domain-containing protein, partial [Verrucomicrobiae bacterium]|nr:hemerythrin domain-containing protein [Verrucomicrobiae bacterium]
EDHRKVKELFRQFEEAEDDSTKKEIAQTAIKELKVHTALEEELFYPAVRREIDEEEKIDEALEEHHVAKLLIAELSRMKPSDEHFDAKFKVLAESVKHHIEEEEGEMLPEVEGEIDADGLGKQMAERKQKLEGRMNGMSTGRGGARKSTRGRRGSSSKRRRGAKMKRR